MTAKDKEPVKRVEKIIKEFDENLNVSLLKTSARTALEAATSLNCDVGAIVKSLLFKTDNKYALFLVAGDKKASLKKIKKNIKFSDVSMASADEVKSITGYTIGGVSPVGHKNNVDIYIDNSLERFDFLFAAAGHPNCIFKISFFNTLWTFNCMHERTFCCACKFFHPFNFFYRSNIKLVYSIFNKSFNYKGMRICLNSI